MIEVCKGHKARKEVAALKGKAGDDISGVVSESITEELNISEAADGSENKAAFVRASHDSTDDGYNSSSLSRENTFEGDQYHSHHQSIQKTIDPQARNVDKLVLGLVGSTASAPVFTMFGRPSSSLDSDKEIVVRDDDDCSRANSSASQTDRQEPEVDDDSLESSDRAQVVQTRESSGRVAGVGAIPFNMHPGYHGSDDYSGSVEGDGKLPTEDEILVNEELNHSLMINRESSLIVNQEMELHKDLKDEMKAELLSDDIEKVDVEIYLRPDSSEGKLVLFYLKERQIPHSIKSLEPSDLSQDWFLNLSSEGLDPVMRFNSEDVVVESLKIMDFLERKLPVDIYPMAIPCSTSTRSYQKYLFYSALLHTIPMEGIKLRAAPDQRRVKVLEELLLSLKGEIS